MSLPVKEVVVELNIDTYIEQVRDEWNIRIDHEDGSTAPFTSLALEELCSK